MAVNTAGAVPAASQAGRQIPIYSVETQEMKVSLGFNCAWDNADIPELIAILEEHGVKATFFISGGWCEKYPESVRALSGAGHEIGSHSNTHADLAKLGKKAIIEEIVLCNEKIKAATGASPTLFRMPSGSYNKLVIETLREQGMIPIQWDIDTVDYKDPPPEEMRANIRKNLRKGSIILLHSGAKNTPAALPGILADIKAAGYTAVPVSQLILDEPYRLDHEGRQHSIATR
ncbi:MAG: polysaccharide deacetylase family protein [Oscillospiraceae bacterium]|nr:polysaccharide deacetylase family protein [Oscillospiraceae bacterium]